MRFDSDDGEPKLIEEIDLSSKASEVRDNKGLVSLILLKVLGR